MIPHRILTADGIAVWKRATRHLLVAPAIPNGGGHGAAAAARQQHSYRQQMLREQARAATLQNQLCVPGSDVNWEFMHERTRTRRRTSGW